MSKEKEREYWQRYYQKHKEELSQKHKEWYQKNRDKVRQYYRENKESIYKSQQKYNAKNRKKVTRMVLDCRKKNADKFKAEGQMFCYQPKTERQNNMVRHLCKKTGIDQEYSRQILERNNWNIKGILGVKK